MPYFDVFKTFFLFFFLECGFVQTCLALGCCALLLVLIFIVLSPLSSFFHYLFIYFSLCPCLSVCLSLSVCACARLKTQMCAKFREKSPEQLSSPPKKKKKKKRNETNPVIPSPAERKQYFNVFTAFEQRIVVLFFICMLQESSHWTDSMARPQQAAGTRTFRKTSHGNVLGGHIV